MNNQKLYEALVQRRREERRARRAEIVAAAVLVILGAALVVAACLLIGMKREEAKELSRLQRTSADLAFLRGGAL